MHLIRACNRALATALLLFSCTNAHTQAYPARPIRVVMPFPPGGPSDVLGRALGQKLSEQMGQNVIPDNRAGAGGNLGIALVAKAVADGYTLLVTSSTIAISPSLYSRLDYNTERDFAAVARLAMIPNVLLILPSLPAKTLRQFVELARADPGKLNFGSGGTGTTNHLANELLMSLEKIKLEQGGNRTVFTEDFPLAMTI